MPVGPVVGPLFQDKSELVATPGPDTIGSPRRHESEKPGRPDASHVDKGTLAVDGPGLENDAAVVCRDNGGEGGFHHDEAIFMGKDELEVRRAHKDAAQEDGRLRLSRCHDAATLLSLVVRSVVSVGPRVEPSGGQDGILEIDGLGKMGSCRLLVCRLLVREGRGYSSPRIGTVYIQ